MIDARSLSLIKVLLSIDSKQFTEFQPRSAEPDGFGSSAPSMPLASAGPLWTVTFTDSAQGLVITPKLSGLPPGEHGFHIHDKGDCGPGMNQDKPAAGFAAGGHYDPAHTKKHLGPLNIAGHRGDLPVLVVDSRGDATEAVTAPHLTVDQIRGHSIMIHAGGDNSSDTPAPLGGGGARIACGVIH